MHDPVVYLFIIAAMKRESNTPFVVNSILEQHRLLALPKPQHPLVSVFRFEDIAANQPELAQPFVLNFYCIAIKKNFAGKLKYGQGYYDFDEGMMSFISPAQVLLSEGDERARSGWSLAFHPDFIANYPLGKAIKNYGFFSYALNEALHLSEKEEALVTAIVRNIENEYQSPIDAFSQDVIVSQIELLLTYANRFYSRQFLTRKKVTSDLLAKFETLLQDYFNSDDALKNGLPTVQYISAQLSISPSYLGDMLRNLTGQNTQQHIHNHVIEKAKEILSTTNRSVSEIAYQLGFEYPQSFNKLFKSKTNTSPLEFRHSFN